MEANRKARILIVDDSEQDLRIHATTLREQGYDVVTAYSGEEALAFIETEIPDLFLIDTKMQGMDGYSLCERIKQNTRLLNVPVIFVTNSRKPEDIDRNYSAGGVDYIVKPCHLSEFLARVRTQLNFHDLLREVERLREIAIDSNPLTHLPGNHTIMAKVQEAVDRNLDVGIIYADLDHFKAYNDAYGFSAGDEMLLFTAETLLTVLRSVCNEEGFIGHIGGDDFVLIVPGALTEAVGLEIVQRFDQGANEFYSDADRKKGHVVTIDRQGKEATFPLVSISMGGLNLRQGNYTRYVEVATVCAEVKHKAKFIAGSNIFLDIRSNPTLDPVPAGES